MVFILRQIMYLFCARKIQIVFQNGVKWDFLSDFQTLWWCLFLNSKSGAFSLNKSVFISSLLKEFLFDWPTSMHPEPDLTTISATLMALFEHAEMAKEAMDEAAYSYDYDDDRDLADSEVSEAKYNYPDLVPRTCSRKLSLREQPNVIEEDSDSSSSIAVMSENFFLLAIFLGTCILLYFFPPGPWIFAYYS